MINGTNLEFTDISSEEYRQYIFSSDCFVWIIEPTHLNVCESGGHRVLDSRGVSHYVAPGWIHLTWKAKPGQPNFVK